MKTAQTPEEIQTVNQPINRTSVKALRHLLAALQAYHELDFVTSEACLASRWTLESLKVELDRLWDGAV